MIAARRLIFPMDRAGVYQRLTLPLSQVAEFLKSSQLAPAKLHQITALICSESRSPQQLLSAADVLIKPVDRALPREIGRRLVIAFGRSVAVEPVDRPRIDIAFMRYTGFLQGRIVSGPTCPRVVYPVLHGGQEQPP